MQSDRMQRSSSVAVDPPRTHEIRVLSTSRHRPDALRTGSPPVLVGAGTAGKDLYVSETTDLVETGAQDATGAGEASAAPGTAGRTRRRGSGLSGMLLPELQRLAAELGIPGTARMRKGDLVAAISARQVGGNTSADTS